MAFEMPDGWGLPHGARGAYGAYGAHAQGRAPEAAWGTDWLSPMPEDARGEKPTRITSPSVLSRADFSTLERKRLTRLGDIRRKKQNRKETKVLLRTLAELEAKERGISGPVHSRDAKLHTVMERLTRRLKLMAAKKRPQKLEKGSLPTEVVSAGLMGARSLGVLYVCVEDWVVRSSNSAMELVCPFELLRGYVGLCLPAVVHPDDHLQLALLQKEQVYSIKDGEMLALSVRMLRACDDRGTLVMAWRRQILEVARISRDEEHGGKLHVLFTCVLEADSLEPLTFDASDRRQFQETAEGVGGAFAPDPHRTTDSFDSISKMMNEGGFSDRSDAAPVADLAHMMSYRLGRVMGIPQLLGMLKRGAMSALNHLVRSHVLWGIGPDGAPRLQISAGLRAFGFVSGYHTFFTKAMSTRAHAKRGEFTICGVLKPRECAPAVEGAAALGMVGMNLVRNEDPAVPGDWHIVCVGQLLYTDDALNQAAYERTWMAFFSKKRDGALPQRTDVDCTRVGPTEPHLIERFYSFGPELVAPPFAEFLA